MQTLSSKYVNFKRYPCDNSYALNDSIIARRWKDGIDYKKTNAKAKKGIKPFQGSVSPLVKNIPPHSNQTTP